MLKNNNTKKLKLVYIMSLRNSAADKAGQMIDYQGEKKYMKSPLEFLVENLKGELGNIFDLQEIIYDDDPLSTHDIDELKEYGFSYQKGKNWIFPKNLTLPDGTLVINIIKNIPSSYRKLPIQDPKRPAEKHKFEIAMLERLNALKPDVILLDGLLVILKTLVGKDSPYKNKIINIHPGITKEGSLYERRGLHATMDALYGAKGKKVINWETMETQDIKPVLKTGASLHFVDENIDSGEVIYDALNTIISPEDTIFELRWKNFNNSVFPALTDGLMHYAKILKGGDSYEIK